MKYSTIQGDMWDSISYKLFGTEQHMSKLMELNPRHNRTVIFSAGVKLHVPVIATQTATDLPPWKRGGSS